MGNATNHVVIMAGGVGSRFWPMSTSQKPKQFIDVLGCGRSLLQLTVERFEDICPLENVWVVTSESYASTVRQQLPRIPVENILMEPCRRNTAPCIAYVSWKILQKDPSANIVVTPSDHVVMNVKEFRRVIGVALDYTAHNNAVITLGMQPTRPETGYGYIEADTDAQAHAGEEILRVQSFKEKPDRETAVSYINQSNYYWNAGIFVWNVRTIVEAFRKHQPAIAAIFDTISTAFFTASEQTVVDKEFPKCENISVDYAILEKAANVFVIPANFGWSDLGTWGSLYEQLHKQPEDNVCIGENVHMIDSKHCIVHTSQERKVVIQGLDGYIVAEKDDTLLICKLSEEQRIKDFSAM